MYDSPCMTWTVYWTLILCRLPTLIQPALLSDYPECLPPGLILSLNSDSDSALSTLCLKLVIELCLFDLHSVLIKLHMDPNATDSSLQALQAMRTAPDMTGFLLRKTSTLKEYLSLLPLPWQPSTAQLNPPHIFILNYIEKVLIQSIFFTPF